MKNKYSKQYPIFLSLILIIAITCMAGITTAFFHYKTGEDKGLTVGYTRVDDNVSFSVSGDEIISGAIMNQPLITNASFSLTEGSRPVYLRVGLEYQSTADEPTPKQLTTITALNTDFVKADQSTVKVENEYYWSYYDGYYYLFDGNPTSDKYNELLSISDSNISYTLFNEQNPVLFPSLIELFHHFGITHAADNEELKLHVDAQAVQSEYLPSYEFNDLVALFDTLNPKPASNSVIVAFNSLGGSEVLSQIVTIGGNVSAPTVEPVKLGYAFAGWYTSEDNGVTLSETPYDFDTMVTESLVLYAKWTHVSYTLTFMQGDVSFATAISPINFTIEEGVSADKFPANPIDSSGLFNFLYWVDSNGERVTSIPAGTRRNVILTAMWDNVWTGNTATGFLGGTGTEEDPYLIATAAQLDYFRAQVDGRRKFTGEYIKLVNNIKLNDENGTRTFADIGGTDIYTIFEGTFLGNNKTISGLYNSILFSYIGQPATVQDLTLEGRRTSKSYSFASSNYGTIKNCNNHVTNTNFVNYNYNTIIDCNNYADLTMTSEINSFGGIANYNSCTKGSTGSNFNYNLSLALIKNCINYGNISTTSNLRYVGGIVGRNENNAHVVNCQNKGEIKSTVSSNSNNNSVGGIVGWIINTIPSNATLVEIKNANLIVNCVNDGNITALYTSYLAGIVGNANTNSPYASAVRIVNCVNNGIISGYTYNAGIIGYAYGTSNNLAYTNGIFLEIDNSTNNGEILSTSEYTAGIIGYSGDYVRVSDCINYGYIHSTYRYTAGIVASKYSSSDILNCVNYGKIEGTTDVGGIVSYDQGTTTNAYYGQLGYVSNCINLGEIVCNTGYGLGPGTSYRNSFYLDSKSTQGGTGAYQIDTTVEDYTISENLYGNFNKVVDLLNIYVLLYGRGLNLKYWDVLEVEGEDTISQVDELPSRYKYHAFNIENGYEYIRNHNTRPIGYIEGMVYEFEIQANSYYNGDYKFMGWYTSEDFDPNTTFIGLYGNETQDINLYIKALTPAESFDGLGTVDSPYEINSKDDLLLLNSLWYSNAVDSSDGVKFNATTKYYLQTADITFNSAYLSSVESWDDTTEGLENWIPLGNSSNSFVANYDGGNYKISGLYVNQTTSYAGFFGCYNGKSLKNINIASGYIKGSSNVGGICGYVYSSLTMDNCKNYAKVVATTNYVGGLIGYAYGCTINNSINNGSLECVVGCAGGIVGYSSGTLTISTCINNGDISNNGNSSVDLGGIIGQFNGTATITNCSNTARINYDGDINSGLVLRLGGIIGYNSSGKFTLSSCHNTGDITQSGMVKSQSSNNSIILGGLIGYMYQSNGCTISDSSNNCDIIQTSNITSGSYYVGGCIGYLSSYTSNISIDNLINEGTISAISYVGGIIGRGFINTISNLTNKANISGSSCVGGIFGFGTIKDEITNAYNYGTISGG